MTPVTPSPTTGVSVTADATATGGTPRAATVPTSATSTPDVPDATAAPVVAGATPTGAQGVAAAHGPDARTPSALTGGTVPGDASAGSAAPADRTDGPDGASRAVGVVAAATASADTATGQVRAADRSAPTVDPGPTPTATAGTVDGAPAYALTPTGAPHGGTGAPMVTTADARLAQPALPPQAQVLNAVSPLLTTADGTHRLTVHLAPAHLGSVQVHLEVRGGEVTVRLTAVDPATGDALRQGTPELRSHLERIGLRSAGIDVQVAPGAPTGDPAAGGAATADRGPRDQDQRNPGPWAGPDGTGAGDTARDGAWQRHGRPLEGWTPRADGPRTTRHTPGASDQLDPHRPRPRDVRVDVRM
ncbi:flagellar hook-length control protein FliK [Phycicoccus sp. 3266]|uniref:flagellar hook-length control protein FliK n=1 Tax=Phycicoccus sp. 3266 TaxID=2817751 RepID=UPI002862ECF6|nr:flagellar hook-length control protein FliK [Phycicoccus sp. 3266]MDR6862954.1 hypothetical protein [Phycicoccus sp. 3266]